MREVFASSADHSEYFFLVDSATGLGKTGLVYSDMIGSYTRAGSARTAITMATQTVTGAHSDGGFVEVDATNCPGLYRFDVPDAAFASGVESVVATLKASGIVTAHKEFRVVLWDKQTALSSTTIGSISGVSFPANFSALAINASGHISRVTLVDTTTVNTDMRGTDGAYTGTPPSAAAIADAVWDELQSEHTTAGTFGYYLDAAISSITVSGGGGGAGVSSGGDLMANLKAARDNIAVQLADMTANPKPSYTIDGQRVDWDTHFKALSSELDRLNLAIQAAEPFEIHTTGYTS